MNVTDYMIKKLKNYLGIRSPSEEFIAHLTRPSSLETMRRKSKGEMSMNELKLYKIISENPLAIWKSYIFARCEAEAKDRFYKGSHYKRIIDFELVAEPSIEELESAKRRALRYYQYDVEEEKYYKELMARKREQEERKKKMKITTGAIKGRHNLPVNEYVFDEIEDVTDYASIKNGVENFLDAHFEVELVPIHKGCDCYGDTFHIKEGNQLILYVTGLTCVTAQIIASCFERGIDVKLMHYDVSSNAYVEQMLEAPFIASNSEW